jgi:RNA polymerase sigma factor (sigma-70 family)
MRADASYNGHLEVTGDSRFADLYRRYQRHIHAYCARRTEPHLVDDAVAETFLVAWRKIEQMPVGDQILPWLYGVARLELAHQWRHAARRRRLVERLQGVARVDVPSADVYILRGVEYDLVAKAASRLQRIDQEVLRLTLWEELSYVDAATVLEISPEAVKQRLFRARKNLTREYRRLDLDRKRPPAARKGGAR